MKIFLTNKKFKEKDFNDCEIHHNGYIEMRLSPEDQTATLKSIEKPLQQERLKNINLLRIAKNKQLSRSQMRNNNKIEMTN